MLVGVEGTSGLVWLWVAFLAFMAIRSAGMLARARTDIWLVTGMGR